VNYRFTNSTGGISTGAFLSLNLAQHVGDKPELVAHNRTILEREIGLPTQYMNQVHGDQVLQIQQLLEDEPTADGLLTTNTEIALAVMVADCIPLLLSNKSSVAAVHVGRRGLVNNIALVAISKMRAIDSSSITAVIGPAICGKCYEVSEDIYTEVVDQFPLAQARTQSGALSLDLTKALKSLLMDQGVKVIEENLCTVEESSLYSYRRDGVTGRQVGVVWL
jgi:YfiH family protein